MTTPFALLTRHGRVLALAVIAACQPAAETPVPAGQPPAVDSVAALRTQMRAVDDSITRMLADLEGGNASLQRADSTRGALEAQATRLSQVNERLATDAPDVYRRLGRFVEEHKALQGRIVALNDTIAVLRDRVRSLEARNSALRQQVAAARSENAELRREIGRLIEDSTARARKLAELDSSRTAILARTSRAYVAIASRDSLARLGIAGKTNFLRLGPTVLKRFDRDVFRLVDTRRDTLFAVWVPMRDVEILSTHPSGSYVLIDEGPTSQLRVLDADAFWSISRTLAVMTNRE